MIGVLRRLRRRLQGTTVKAHHCHSPTHGICVPSLEWRTHSKPTKTTRFILQETWDSPASALQTRFDYHSLVLLYKMRSSLAPPYLCTLFPRRVSDSTLERTAEGNPRVQHVDQVQNPTKNPFTYNYYDVNSRIL